MKRLSVLLVFLVFLTDGFPLFAQESWHYTGNNEVFLKISGTESDYEFVSHHLKTGMDRERKAFGFIIPVETLQPTGDPSHLSILRDLFPYQTTPTITLTAILEEETVTLEDFSQPQHLVLNGVLSLNEESFYLPVDISVYANRNELFYNMIAHFDLDLIDKSYEGKYEEIITGEFVIYVNEGSWNSAFPE